MTNIKRLIEQRLRAWLRAEQAQAQTPEARQLLQYIEQVTLRAGKRARPRLLFLTYQAYAGTTLPALADIGLALELHHQFLLIHDDVMDNDVVRHDGPNVAGLYLADGLPEPVAAALAILAGNLLYSYADQVITGSKHLTAAQKVAVLQQLHATNVLVQQGQQLDVMDITGTAAAATITAEKLLLINSLKTAAYTVQLPMALAAELLELSAAERQRIDRFAENFGILYQLVDDYNDYFATAATKHVLPTFRDFKQAKITYPLWYVLQTATVADRAHLKRCLGKKRLSVAQQKTITTILVDCGAMAAAATQINQYRQQTVKALSTLKVSPEGRQQLQALVDQYQI